MEKFSVKKPFTVLVAVVMILILGFVAVTKMDTNLLPNVNTPYLMVVTVYPGASPERVESEVSDVLQNSLTVPGVSKITATSAENYSLLLMEFTEDTDMNSALVKVSNKLDQAKSDLPSTCLTPSIIEYSLNMNAFMTVAVPTSTSFLSLSRTLLCRKCSARAVCPAFRPAVWWKSWCRCSSIRIRSTRSTQSCWN